MTYIIAHRGYCKTTEPDNSIPAFQSALNAKADGIEFDIQLSSDEHFVCFHDPDLSNLGRPEQLNELDLKTLTEIELATGITIPSLADVLEKYGNRIFLNIELKTQNKGVEELIQLLNQYDIEKNPKKLIISSFHGNALKNIKNLDSDIPTGLLVEFSRNMISQVQEYNCDALHLFYNEVPDGWINLPFWLSSKIHKFYAHRCFSKASTLGIFVNPYTVNSDQYLRNCFERNVNGVITDNVERAYQIRKETVNPDRRSTN